MAAGHRTDSHAAADAQANSELAFVRDTPHPKRCSDGALRVATRICSSFPEPHRVIVLSGLTKKNPVGQIAYEVAMALAMMDVGRVLLVDANSKQPFLGDLIRLRDKKSGNGKYGPPGLAQILTSDVSVSEVLLSSEFSNLDFLTNGAAFDPSLFLSERCGIVLKHLREQYTFVLIATDPVMASPESMRLAVHCDALAAVISPNRHSQVELRQLNRDLSTLSIPFLGVIFSTR